MLEQITTIPRPSPSHSPSPGQPVQTSPNAPSNSAAAIRTSKDQSTIIRVNSEVQSQSQNATAFSTASKRWSGADSVGLTQFWKVGQSQPILNSRLNSSHASLNSSTGLGSNGVTVGSGSNSLSNHNSQIANRLIKPNQLLHHLHRQHQQINTHNNLKRNAIFFKSPSASGSFAAGGGGSVVSHYPNTVTPFSATHNGVNNSAVNSVIPSASSKQTLRSQSSGATHAATTNFVFNQRFFQRTGGNGSGMGAGISFGGGANSSSSAYPMIQSALPTMKIFHNMNAIHSTTPSNNNVISHNSTTFQHPFSQLSIGSSSPILHINKRNPDALLSPQMFNSANSANATHSSDLMMTRDNASTFSVGSTTDPITKNGCQSNSNMPVVNGVNAMTNTSSTGEYQNVMRQSPRINSDSSDQPVVTHPLKSILKRSSCENHAELPAQTSSTNASEPLSKRINQKLILSIAHSKSTHQNPPSLQTNVEDSISPEVQSLIAITEGSSAACTSIPKIRHKMVYQSGTHNNLAISNNHEKLNKSLNGDMHDDNDPHLRRGDCQISINNSEEALNKNNTNRTNNIRKNRVWNEVTNRAFSKRPLQSAPDLKRGVRFDLRSTSVLEYVP